MLLIGHNIHNILLQYIGMHNLMFSVIVMVYIEM